jgi:hypothetical protein
MGEAALREDVHAKKNYQIYSYFILNGVTDNDWNWSEIHVPRDVKATIPVMLGPDVLQMYKIKEVYFEDLSLDEAPFLKLQKVTDTMWFIYDDNKEKRQLKFGVILEPVGGGESMTVDPLIVNE